MSRNKKPGYFCAVKSCSTKNDGSTTFFRFPKGDLTRCQEWLRLCSRDELMHKTDENYFYNNLRVCAKHFENRMFLNDLHNRLQPHAKPILHVCNILRSILVAPKAIDTRQSMEQPSCSHVKPTDVTLPEPAVSSVTIPRLEKNIHAVVNENRSSFSYVKPTDVAPSEPAVSSVAIPRLEKTIHAVVNENRSSFSYVKPTDVTPSEPAASFVTVPRLEKDVDAVVKQNRPADPSAVIQTFLSAYTPRKQQLKRKFQVQQENLPVIKKTNLEIKPKFTLEDFKEMCDTFLSEPLAKFVKAQANVKTPNTHRRRYSDSF